MNSNTIPHTFTNALWKATMHTDEHTEMFTDATDDSCALERTKSRRRNNDTDQFVTAQSVQGPEYAVNTIDIPLRKQPFKSINGVYVDIFANYSLSKETLQKVYDDLTKEGWVAKIPGLYDIWGDDPSKPDQQSRAMPTVIGPASWFTLNGKVVGNAGCSHEYFSGECGDMNSATVHTIWSSRGINCNSWLDMMEEPEKYVPLLEEFYDGICETMRLHLTNAHPGIFGIPKGEYTLDEIKNRIRFCACHTKSSLKRFHLHIASTDKQEQVMITEAGASEGDRHISFSDLIWFLNQKIAEKK